MDRLELENKIKSVALTQEDYDYIEESTKDKRMNYIVVNGESKSGQDVMKIFEEIYIMRYILDISTYDMAEYLGSNYRTMQLRLKKYGWQRDKYEAQAIATKKRDYTKIIQKGRKTMLDNATWLGGGQIEQYVRVAVNETLNYALKGYECIVGVSNRSILIENNLEIDIPIIVINKNNIYRYALEVNGYAWHQDNIREIKKEKLAKEKGYILLKIWVDGSLDNNKGTIERQLNAVTDFIIGHVKSQNKLIKHS